MNHVIIDLHGIHVVKTSKTKTLLTGVESDDFIDSEGNLVSVDVDFSLTPEVHDLVKELNVKREEE